MFFLGALLSSDRRQGKAKRDASGHSPTVEADKSSIGDWQFAVMPTKEAVRKSNATALKALELDENLGRSAQFACVLPGWLQLESCGS